MNKNTSITIRMDQQLKEQAQSIFSDLGMDMSTAINVFLKQAVRFKGFPFDLSLNVPNEITLAAMEEGDRLADDPNTPRYHSVDELRKALDV